MTLNASLQDLQVAERAIERMAEATRFRDLYEAWEDYLFRIERAWERTERALRREKGFQQWFKPYTDLKKRDPLLRFLAHARDAETHAVSNTLDKPVELSVKEKFGRPFSVRNISSEFKDGVLDINIDSPDVLMQYDVSVLPTDPILIRFKNRGVWYNPPRSYLGNGLQDLHPVVAAKLGLDFYKSFLKEAISKFG